MDKPILFSAPMIRALLEGRKTQTRRVLKPQPPAWAKVHQSAGDGWEWVDRDADSDSLRHWPDYYQPMRPPYAPGDRLWVRETWGVIQAHDGLSPREIGMRHFYDGRYHGSVGYVTDPSSRWCQTGCNGAAGRWRPSIHMPRWASRLTLVVTDVRVQRIREIDDADAFAEGIQQFVNEGQRDDGTARGAFRALWDSLNARRGHGWDANPWVAAITFTVHKQNIDSMAAGEPK